MTQIKIIPEVLVRQGCHFFESMRGKDFRKNVIDFRARNGNFCRMKLRLPFALGLAIASVTMAVINLWPFTPPDAASRIRAAAVDEAPEVLRPMLADRLYPPLEKPRPGDWLASGHEWAQSVKASGVARFLPEARHEGGGETGPGALGSGYRHARGRAGDAALRQPDKD
jgi:hypothetical protein